MKALVKILSVMILGTVLSAGQIVRYATSPDLVGVPSSGTGGLPGGASNPLNVAQNTTAFPDALVIGFTNVNVYLGHGRVGDLTMTLSHCGTTVTLFSGSANQAASVNGYFTFNDIASTTFASAVAASPGSVPAGPYRPAQALSAFNGQSSTGPWILTLADLASGVSGSAGFMEIGISSGGNFGGAIVPVQPIPDGYAGACVAPVTHVVNVAGSGQIGLMTLTLGLVHTYTSDLRVVLSHGGVTATIMSHDPPNSGANLSGLYTFADDAATSWTQAVAPLPTSATVPAGSYRPLTPLAVFSGLDQAGPWFVTVCDQAAADTGWLSDVYMTIGKAAWDLEIEQPNGAASVTVRNSGGRMGGTYANMMTLTPGAFPNGWLYGVDMTFLEIASEIGLGAPFFGPLGPCGSATTTVPGPIPSGLTVYVTGLELDGSGSIVNFKPAFAYETP